MMPYHFQYIEYLLNLYKNIEMPPTWRRELGKQIRAARREKRWTQGFLAKQIGMSAGSLSYYETGKAPVDFEKLISIARVLATGFDVRGYRLAPFDDSQSAELMPAQLRLEFDKEHTFAADQISINPTREGKILIRAVAHRQSSRETA